MAKRRRGAAHDSSAEISAIEQEFAREMQSLRDRKRDALARVKRKTRADAAADRRDRRARARKMAFELGEFVLAQGPGSAIYESVVGSAEFDAFMTEPRRIGRRPLFGLSSSENRREAGGKT